MRFPQPHLRFLRDASGVSQAAVADLMGIDRSQVAQYELGRRTMTPERWSQAAPAYALGPRDPDERAPAFLVGHFLATDDLLYPLAQRPGETKRRLLAFRTFADLEPVLSGIRGLDRRFELLAPVPAWRSYVKRVAELRGAERVDLVSPTTDELAGSIPDLVRGLEKDLARGFVRDPHMDAPYVDASDPARKLWLKALRPSDSASS